MATPNEPEDDHTGSGLFPSIYVKDNLKEHLFQGDLIIDYESRMIPTYEPPALGLIVLSESCDLEHGGRITYISFSPVYQLEVFVRNAAEGFIERRGRDAGFDSLLDSIRNRMFDLVNYVSKNNFFLPPDEVLGGSAAFSSIEQISHIPMSYADRFLKRRKSSLKSPWREKLGFKTGYLFNRVATHTPDKEDLKEWVETTYGDIIREYV